MCVYIYIYIYIMCCLVRRVALGHGHLAGWAASVVESKANIINMILEYDLALYQFIIQLCIIVRIISIIVICVI